MPSLPISAQVPGKSATGFEMPSILTETKVPLFSLSVLSVKDQMMRWLPALGDMVSPAAAKFWYALLAVIELFVGRVLEVYKITIMARMPKNMTRGIDLME